MSIALLCSLRASVFRSSAPLSVSIPFRRRSGQRKRCSHQSVPVSTPRRIYTVTRLKKWRLLSSRRSTRPHSRSSQTQPVLLAPEPPSPPRTPRHAPSPARPHIAHQPTQFTSTGSAPEKAPQAQPHPHARAQATLPINSQSTKLSTKTSTPPTQSCGACTQHAQCRLQPRHAAPSQIHPPAPSPPFTTARHAHTHDWLLLLAAAADVPAACCCAYCCAACCYCCCA